MKMRKLWIILCLLLMSTLAGLGVQAATMTLDEALAVFHGDDVCVPYSDQGKAQLEAVIEAFRVALAVPPSLDETDQDAVSKFAVDVANKNIVNKLCQCYYTYADVFLTGKDQQLPVYKKGKAWGFKSLRMNPDFAATWDRIGGRDGFMTAVKAETDVAALYWTNSNWLRIAEFDIPGAVLGHIPEQSLVIADRTLELQPDYICYGSYRSLGTFWAKLPGDAFTRALIGMGQDLQKSLDYFCKVVSDPGLCPNCTDCPLDPSVNEYFENRLFFAQYYLMEESLWQNAKRVLESILADPIGTKYPLYNAVDQEKARTLLDEVNKHL